MLEYREYKLSWDPIETYQIPEDLQEELEEIFVELQMPRRKTISKIKKFIEKYPEIPQFKDFLSALYKELGEYDKASEVNDQMLEDHPDYFHSLINKAHQYETNEEYHEMEELMGKGFDLKTLYPERDVFYIDEFISMQLVAVGYYSGIGELDQAEVRLKMIEDVDPDSESIEIAREKILMGKMKMASKRYEEEKKNRITPKHIFSPEEIPNEAPEFNYIETQQLYLSDFGEDIEVIRNYLSLDRGKLIEDLEKVLKYDYALFLDCDDEEGFGVGFHAYNLLGELEATESLPVIFEMMRMSDDYRLCTFGDFMTQDGWIALMKMTKSNPEVLEDYLKLPGVETFFRSVATDVLKQIYLHYPEKRAEVKAIYQRLLQYFINATIEDEVVDTELNGFIVWDLIDLKLSEFLPQIKEIFESGIVNPGVCGTYGDVEQDIKSGEIKADVIRNPENIYDLYEQYFSDESPEIDMEEILKESLELQLFSQSKFGTTIKKQNVGRNDPCPCDSGKKFKKCCMGKGIYD